jgi:hypothetical protein
MNPFLILSTSINHLNFNFFLAAFLLIFEILWTFCLTVITVYFVGGCLWNLGNEAINSGFNNDPKVLTMIGNNMIITL